MNIKLHKVLSVSSDIKGQSGPAILRSIANEQKDPEELVKHIHFRVKATKEEILKSLEGKWSESQVFILKQNLDCYLYTQGQIRELDSKLGVEFIEKFSTADKFCCRLNLVPKNKKSGGKILSSKVPKRKNYVGQVLQSTPI